MEVQTYEIEEPLEGTTPELEEKAKQLIDDLGLEGQKELIRPKEDGTEERIQYPEMTAQEIAVYEAIFPSKTPIGQYSAGILPVRVLQVIAHARSQFDEVHVWHRRVQDPDPILVGKIKEGYPGKRYLLARWGEALEDYSVLLEKAREIIKTNLGIMMRKKRNELESDLNQIDDIVERALQGETIYY